MPKVIARVLNARTDDQGWLIADLRFNQKMPKKGDLVTVKWGSVRTIPQNSLYWKYLTWVINEGGLKDIGHFSAQALHENLKEYFLSEKIMIKGQFTAIEDPTTTTLDKVQFGEYFSNCDKLMGSFFHIDTSPFWEEYERDWKM